MRNRSHLHVATLAIGCALLLAVGSTAHAQASKSQPIDSSGAKSSHEQPKSGEQSEHKALSKAHQTAINQAQALRQYADQHERKLDKSALNRYTEAIGRALDDAQQHRQSLEASVPPDSSAADQFQTVRDKQQSAAEHYRSLVQDAAKTNPDAGDLADEADDIVGDLKNAEAAHKRTFSASTATKDTSGTPGNSPGSNSRPSGPGTPSDQGVPEHPGTDDMPSR
jgi:hypothetical protein